jgi:ElaB/YqjD/DUF883 family membrane-anchored ribosome-binding protein
MKEKLEDKRINEALDLLNEAAKEKKAELQGMISEKYKNLKAALGAGGERLEKQASEALNKGKDEVAELAKKVDDSVRKNPWPYIGGTALGFLLLGLLLGRSGK